MPVNGAADPGYGPPVGSSSDGPYPQIPLDALAKQYGQSKIDTFLPEGQSTQDPLLTQTRQRVSVVYRDLPATAIQNTWSIPQARAALYAHMIGVFDVSTQLFDAILGDDRVMATLGSRVSGLFGRDVRFRSADDSLAAKECRLAWEKWWPRFTSDAALWEAHTYAIGMGFSPSQLVWDTSGDIWGPNLRPWYPRYTRYDWPSRLYVAYSLDGEIPIVPGNGKWVLHAPHGAYRGWIRGAIRALTEPWMLRHFAFRDMARFSEIHGLPTRVGKVPAVCDPQERAAFETSMSMLGANTSMILPQGVDGQDGSGYEYGLVEATDNAWETFPGLIDRCDMAIVLSLLFQNLTTEVKGGSFAATSAHMDIRQSGLQADNMGWRNTIYSQIARPFAYFNFGDADLAPWTEWDVKPRDELSENAKQFQAFGTAVEVLRRGGIEFTDTAELRTFAAQSFGIENLPEFNFTMPVAGGGGGFGK